MDKIKIKIKKWIRADLASQDMWMDNVTEMGGGAHACFFLDPTVTAYNYHLNYTFRAVDWMMAVIKNK